MLRYQCTNNDYLRMGGLYNQVQQKRKSKMKHGYTEF